MKWRPFVDRFILNGPFPYQSTEVQVGSIILAIIFGIAYANLLKSSAFVEFFRENLELISVRRFRFGTLFCCVKISTA